MTDDEMADRSEPVVTIRAVGGARFRCRGCTHCCRSYDVPLADAAEARRIEASVAGRPELRQHPSVVAVRTTEDGLWRVGIRPDGRCVFLRDDDLCALHAAFGEAGKPVACRKFPYRMVRDASGALRASLGFECPSVHLATAEDPSLGAVDGEPARLLAAEPGLPVATVPEVRNVAPRSTSSSAGPTAWGPVLGAIAQAASLRAELLALARPELPYPVRARREVARAAKAAPPRGGDPADAAAASLLALYLAGWRDGGRAALLLPEGARARGDVIAGVVAIVRRLVLVLAGADPDAAAINAAGGLVDQALDGTELGDGLIEAVAAIGAARSA